MGYKAFSKSCFSCHKDVVSEVISPAVQIHLEQNVSHKQSPHFVVWSSLSRLQTLQGSSWHSLNVDLLQIISRVQVGPRPVHIYSINQTSTAWSHADGDGYFYVIPANSSTNVSVGSTVKVRIPIPQSAACYHIVTKSNAFPFRDFWSLVPRTTCGSVACLALQISS